MAYKWGGVILSTQWVPILQVLQSHWKESNAKPPTSLTAGMKFGPGFFIWIKATDLEDQ